MKTYEHKQSFKIKYCDVDFKDELKISAALAYMEEVASDSAEELGFGYSFIKPNGYAFIVSNIYCEFIRPIRLGETVTFKTWPTPPSHVIFGREYQAIDAKEDVLFNASSRWCLMDMATGKLLQSKVIENQDYSTYNITKLIEGIQWKIPTFTQEEGNLKYSLKIANSEYDHNRHVNNTRYADYCLNCFSIEELAIKRLKTFAISYVKQCREGDDLSFYLKELGDGVYFTQGFNQNREIVVQARITFEE